MDPIYSKKQSYIIGFSSLLLSLLGMIAIGKTYQLIKNATVYGVQPSESSNIFWLFKPLYLMLGTAKTAFDAWEFFILAMLFLGSIIFFFKKGKDTRLIAFAFSVILISNLVSIPSYIIYIIKGVAKTEGAGKLHYFIFINAALSIVYFGLSFYILKTIKKAKVLDVITTESGTTIKDTPKGQRFFHFIIDTLIMLLVFFPLMLLIVDSSSKNDFLKAFLKNELALLAFVFVVRMIYYPFFEIIFGSTPAKFLTESRVVNYLAKHPSGSNVFQRTLCRSIPLNPVSFFWKMGWHDSLSNTHVVKEKRTGFKTWYLLFILLIFIPYITFYYLGEEMIGKYEQQKEYTLTQDYIYSFNDHSIQNINSDQAFTLRELGSQDYEVVILKVEKVNGNEVVCRKIIHPKTFTTGYFDVQELYRQQKDSAETYILNKQDFQNAAPKYLTEMDDSRRNGADFFKNGKKYEIKNIYTLSSPVLAEPNYWSEDEYRRSAIGIIFQNNGKSGKILSVKNLEGDVKWTDHFPVDIKNSKKDGNIYLKAENLKPDENFSVELLVEDSLKHRQLYRVDRKQKPYIHFNIYQLN